MVRDLFSSGHLVMEEEIKIAATVMVILIAYTPCQYLVLQRMEMYPGK